MLAPSGGCVQNKLQLAGSHRHWPLASLQSAQSAAGAPYTGARCQHSRPSALPLRFSRYITRLPHVQVRCRPSSDNVPSRAVSGFMSVCHHSPTANEARQHPRDAARAAQKRRIRPRLLLTVYAPRCSGSTLGTLERCQRPRSASPSDLLPVLDAPSAGGEGMIVWNVMVTHTGSRNTCNVKAVGSRST